MVLPHSLRAPIDIDRPEPHGRCDRCGFDYFLRDMSFQQQYLGNSLQTINILVCNERCLDKPSEFLRPVLIGPDPMSPKYPRPFSYAAQNQGGEPPITDVNTIPGDDE